MFYIYISLDILILINIRRWHSAGRLWDILFELASVGDLPLPNLSPQPTNKRDRDISNTISTRSSSSDSASQSSQGVSDDWSRNIATNRRVASNSSRPTSSHSQQQQQQQSSQSIHPMHYAQQQQYPFTLPVYSDELSQLPIHSNTEMPAGTWPSHVPHQYDATASQQQSYPLQNTSQFWSPTLPLSGNVSSDANLNMDGAPLFDETFYDQLATAYPAAFGDEGAVIAPPVNHGFMPNNIGLVGGRGNSLSDRSDPRNRGPLMQATDAHHQRQRQAEHQGQQQQAAMLDSDAMAMWSNAPTGVEYASYSRAHVR